ncbi:MAG: type II toxin-antitoxin system RelE/ParE family toxin [Gammaproteobacteria bacterium]|nr:type II toxin-antitoxin system RelE/ParE family toxin [Gammaproteobacteria bacterium]
MTAWTLVLSPAARDDPRRIHLYGTRSWGAPRSADYLEHLKQRLWQLTEHPETGMPRGELLPAMRSLAVDSHMVFCRPQQPQVQHSGRILHSRQDPELHIG